MIGVVLNGICVAFEVFLLVVAPSPVVIACLVFTVLMFLVTLVMVTRS